MADGGVKIDRLSKAWQSIWGDTPEEKAFFTRRTQEEIKAGYAQRYVYAQQVAPEIEDAIVSNSVLEAGPI